MLSGSAYPSEVIMSRQHTHGGGALMALLKCAACNNEVSDKAVTCPRCGASVAGASPGTGRTGNLASRWKRLGGVVIDALIGGGIVGLIMLMTGVLQEISSGRSM